ncbi:hypothetical protein DWF04_013535 [Cereibacter sphaeroides f. sp. denitrificans]
MTDDPHHKARLEFLTDTAAYFSDKKSIYLELKDEISSELGLPLSEIRICGSAYWGQSFAHDRPFRPAESDLDVALVNGTLFIKCLSEVRQLTWNFSNLTSFRGGAGLPVMFQDYAYKKGIIRVDLMPKTRTKRSLDATSESISRRYGKHFSKITFMVYDSEHSFTVKQIAPTAKFRGAGQ